MRPLQRTTILTATALLVGGLTGCSILGDDASAPGGGGGGAKASVDGAGKTIVKGTFPSPIAAGATVDIAIMGLKVRAKLATLTVQLTPHVPPGGEQNPNPYGLNGGNGLGTSLLDPVNLKRYVVVKDSGSTELQSNDIFTHIANNQPASLTYTFAAPPENVKVLDVQYGAWPTFRNVPVER
ncbi:hypothetical protein [Actinomadura macrotermitis]|uniref:Lipoprotein n=1 Tax=Actinomadura macrotermitis TaxID=2585200 RepID=A0A7K0BRQ1_9ACTN|nr:hypothetical protein [Actinomadura macrotermitis]MQY03831.1 hypothetical protein [Actinomadura macrotermitis]